ncbi:Peptidyl-prolyl cis-trans isomerase cyp6 [Ascosphaera aggregata]|nr:Peptidyl-prolyl cis-trans isomerase cyp6 [Ascosphaera aggregata]
MSVLLETSLGDIVIDLMVDQAPKCCENFLKLCKIKYYNFSPIFKVQKNFSLQTGDPIGPDSPDSDGGSSIWGVLDGPARKTFPITLSTKLKHSERGTVSMATVPSTRDPDERLVASQFLITLGDNLDYLDGKAAPFGTVVEGFDVLDKINNAFLDGQGRPLKDIRIRHTIILDDPYDDPQGLVEPPSSPLPTKAQLATVRIADDEELEEEADEEALEKLRREREARAQALTLEMVGDLPFAEVRPPENVLFVCKLNPVTQDEDLQLIFSRFGPILSCEVIRDNKTGDSLQYAFIEFENQKDCEQAYFKMQGVLIDDHRIHVDFSQSVSRLSEYWRKGENAKRKSQQQQQQQKQQQENRGGFGGVESLERKRQYRDEMPRRERGDRYGMVFDKQDIRWRKDGDAGVNGRARSKSRSNSPDVTPPRRGHRMERHARRTKRDRSRTPERRERDRNRRNDDDRSSDTRYREDRRDSRYRGRR